MRIMQQWSTPKQLIVEYTLIGHVPPSVKENWRWTSQGPEIGFGIDKFIMANITSISTRSLLLIHVIKEEHIYCRYQ